MTQCYVRESLGTKSMMTDEIGKDYTDIKLVDISHLSSNILHFPNSKTTGYFIIWPFCAVQPLTGRMSVLLISVCVGMI